MTAQETEFAAAYRTHVVHDAWIHRQKGYVAQLELMERRSCEVEGPASRLQVAAHRDRLMRLVEDCRLSLLSCYESQPGGLSAAS